ncbi:MAG: hypothetical protein P8J61_08855 [Gammaproteobacteria bacterium]|jgi:hypothetical protein|nr:hypothetical protein [Gammaproteobacteria bacterium]
MDELIFALSSPGTMSTAQWLVLAIGSFIVLGSLYFILKLIKLIKEIGKTTYKPNIGVSRHPYQGQPVTISNDENSAGDSESEPEPANSENSNEDSTKAE